MKTKIFIVADIGESDPILGCFPYLMLAATGECWQVYRDFKDVPKGCVVEVEYGELSGILRWPTGFRRPIRMLLKEPFKHVARVWGKDVAIQNDVPIKYKAPRTVAFNNRITRFLTREFD